MTWRLCEACDRLGRCFVVEALADVWYCAGCLDLLIRQFRLRRVA